MFGCAISPVAKNSKCSIAEARRALRGLYRRAFAHFGPLHWWPGETPFEICVGAILTQNTAWTNVEKAIAVLRRKNLLTVEAMRRARLDHLARAIRSSGYYNQKARKLKTFCDHVAKAHDGRLEKLLALPPARLRAELLALNGIGPETADSIVLYAAGQPIFVIDAYTRRILARMGLTPEEIDYAELQDLFHRCFPPDAPFYNEFHAQIVYLGKEFCRRREPRCGDCPAALRRAAGAID
ncbi:MAG: endonuclease III domain-containing protein [Myxococcales bacterium]|nr:endonuclease III domain-containing protein [Myxococcales bacterium]